MRFINFLGGFMFALGLIAFFYGAINLAALNLNSDFGWTMPGGAYNSAKDIYNLSQIIGCLVASVGGGLASIRKK